MNNGWCLGCHTNPFLFVYCEEHEGEVNSIENTNCLCADEALDGNEHAPAALIVFDRPLVFVEAVHVPCIRLPCTAHTKDPLAYAA
jgi:hypothetical protein